LVLEIIVSAVHHIPSPGASTTREKGFAGPVQERRDSETLDEIWHTPPPEPPADGRNRRPADNYIMIEVVKKEEKKEGL